MTSLIRSQARLADLHIFVASEDPRLKSRHWLTRFGHAVHVKTIRTLRRCGQLRRDCNIDNLFAFWVGRCVTARLHEVIVLGSGDYGLSGELAAEITARGARTRVMTLSLPGSTARDLDARRNPNIAANLVIGMDVLKPRFVHASCPHPAALSHKVA